MATSAPSNPEQQKRILVCANPDLNHIDGSSIWAQTITLVAAQLPGASVDFLARTSPERMELFGSLLDKPNVSVINVSDVIDCSSVIRPTMEMVAEAAVDQHYGRPYDAIIVRGFKLVEHLLEFGDVLPSCWVYLTDIPQDVADYDNGLLKKMQRIAHNCGSILCQTEGFRDLWRTVVPDIEPDKLRLYTPVIPDLKDDDLLPVAQRPPKAVYAGKYTREWKTLEMARGWRRVHPNVPQSELFMIGDKFHSHKGEPDYKSSMVKALETTAGLHWLGALSRENVQENLRSARVGLSWRGESMDHCLEYSTKILEYGGACCAAILNRTPLHEALLGADYPLFANNEEEFVKKLTLSLTDDEVTSVAANTLRKVAEEHTFSKRVEEFRQWMASHPARRMQRKRKLRVLVAGHDLKFFSALQQRLEESGEFVFLVDQWQGHSKHDEAKSRELLGKADIIVCEWCLGNLRWYSQNKRSSQPLIARFHLQERDLPYLAESNWQAIDHIAYVSEYIRQQGQAAFGFPDEKTSVISNFLDDRKFTLKKKTGNAPFTLGMIGVVPARKRLDRALDVLEKLQEVDSRYCLRIKGKNPIEYDWLLKREEELAYYREIYERINASERLRYSVIFDPPGDDVNTWLSMIGFILSPSDFESFHMAIGEGMLTGTVPIVWDWEGAGNIWGRAYVFPDEVTIVEEIKNRHDEVGAQAIRDELLERYSATNTVDAWRCLLSCDKEIHER